MNFQAIIDFWFSELDHSQWYKKDSALDQEIVARFSEIHARAVAGELWAWRCEPEGSLAEVIILDQFSRNMFRGDPRSFAFDPLALALAQTAIDKEQDEALEPEKRCFLYMPFMHSESLAVHEQAVTLFTKLGNANNLDYEDKHKAIIEQYGRYPHRNELLGRESTEAEKEFLTKPGSSF